MSNPWLDLQKEFPVGDQLDIEPAVYTRKHCSTNEAAENAWKDGKDFTFLGGFGRYFSIRDAMDMKEVGIERVMIWIGPRSGVEVKL